MRRVPVCRGEFGLVIRYHVPAVHAMPGPKEVEIEPGMEALYPSADRYVMVDPTDDNRRRGIPGWDRYKDRPEARFFPTPHHAQSVPRSDVVVCPRLRTYGASKNWGGWVQLTDQLHTLGLTVFAGGAPDTSDTRVRCRRAWEYRRPLDATIEAMLSADLVIATDAGLAHLAVLCGTALLIVTHEGRTAPGPQLDPLGRVMEEAYPPVKLEEYYQAANHSGSMIATVDGWDDPCGVAGVASDLIRSYDEIRGSVKRDVSMEAQGWEAAAECGVCHAIIPMAEGDPWEFCFPGCECGQDGVTPTEVTLTHTRRGTRSTIRPPRLLLAGDVVTVLNFCRGAEG